MPRPRIPAAGFKNSLDTVVFYFDCKPPAPKREVFLGGTKMCYNHLFALEAY